MADGGDQNEGPGDEYPLAPSEPGEGCRRPSLSVPEEPPEAPPSNADVYQFTLAELLMLVTAASVFLSLLGLFPQGYTAQNFAGLAGLVVLAWIFVAWLLEPTRPIVRAAFWAMLAMYLVACLVAVIKDWR